MKKIKNTYLLFSKNQYNSICSLNNAEHNTDADWCNGSTADSDSVSRGSSPLSVVPWQGRRMLLEVSGYFLKLHISECGSAW